MRQVSNTHTVRAGAGSASHMKQSGAPAHRCNVRRGRREDRGVNAKLDILCRGYREQFV